MATSTTSFLMDCPQCGVMIPKGGPCSDCHWTENAEATPGYNLDMVREYAARRKVHTINYVIFMLLAFVAGFVSLITAIMWIMFMYLGDIGAFFLIGFLTVVSGILAGVAACAKKWFPIELNCPSCDIRLDELGTNGDHCPNCGTQLK